jgi:hypothetical protein
LQPAGYQWLTPVILATQKAEIRKITIQSQPRQTGASPHLGKNPSQKIELVEWLKTLSSNPSSTGYGGID